MTNGILYRFYTDLEEQNKMDETPFLEFNLLDIKESHVTELKKFQKHNFDLETIFNTASELKYTSQIKQLFAQQLANPSDAVKVGKGKVINMFKIPKIRWRKRSKNKSTYEFRIYFGFDSIKKLPIEETLKIECEDDEEAERHADILSGKYAKGETVSTSKITIGEYFKKWLDTPEAKKLAKKNLERYKGCIELRIIPWLGNIKLYELKPSILNHFCKNG
ncbi:MAG: hypothetical protein H6Q71_1737 [Firmicutes bacterium]|nr:hypothetical protein [Bacillota bacterium]